MLWQRLLFFRDPNDGGGAGGAGAGNDKGAATGAGASGGDDVTKALEAATAARLAAEANLAKIEKERADAEAAEAAKRGEFEKLYAAEKAKADDSAAKLKAYEEREAKRVADLDKSNKAKIKEIPEARRGLVPDGLDAVALDAYLTRNMATLKGEDPAAGARANSGNDTGMDDATVEAKHPDIAAEAKRRGLTPTKWLAILTKTGAFKPPATA